MFTFTQIVPISNPWADNNKSFTPVIRSEHSSFPSLPSHDRDRALGNV